MNPFSWLSGMNGIYSVIVFLGMAMIGVFGFMSALRVYFDYRIRLAETYNTHAKEVIRLVKESDERYWKLIQELENLQKEFENKSEEHFKHCESIKDHFREFRMETMKIIELTVNK